MKPMIVIFLYLGVTLPVYGAEFQADRGSCERLLRQYIPFTEAQETLIPLQHGGVRGQVFTTLADVQKYLRANPGSPYAAELNLIQASHFDGAHVIYVSEIGPSLWRTDEFLAWRDTVKRETAKTPGEIRDLLTLMARGHHVPGFSDKSHERLRNAFLAAAEAELGQVEILGRNINYFRQQDGSSSNAAPPRASESLFGHFMQPGSEPLVDPNTGKPIDLKKIAPENREAYVHSVFAVHGFREHRRVANEMRMRSPSLNIQFKMSDDVLHAGKGDRFDDFLLPHESDRLPWIVRLLLREALVRRKLAVNAEGQLTTLNEKIDDNAIFLLAAHPEAAPLWNHLPLNDFDIRTYELTSDMHAFTLSPLLINGARDRCLFELTRGEGISARSLAEPVEGVMTLTTKDSLVHECNFIGPRDVQRLREWLATQWEAYSRDVGLDPSPSPTIERHDAAMTVNFDQISLPRILGFYAYLAQIFPAEQIGGK